MLGFALLEYVSLAWCTGRVHVKVEVGWADCVGVAIIERMNYSGNSLWHNKNKKKTLVIVAACPET